jgi:hypothetical protein
MSTLYTDNIRANNASQITVPTGQKIVGTDSGSIVAPGHVIQTVFAQSTAYVQTSVSDLTAPVDCLSATITPKSSSSKILVLASHIVGGSADGIGVNVFLKRGGTLLPISEIGGDTAGLMVYGIARPNDHSAHHGFQHLNSPNTTSATTYTVAIGRYGGSGTANYHMNGTKDKNTLTLMEIAQ